MGKGVAEETLCTPVSALLSAACDTIKEIDKSRFLLHTEKVSGIVINDLSNK